jgi:hypothetical protein
MFHSAIFELETIESGKCVRSVVDLIKFSSYGKRAWRCWQVEAAQDSRRVPVHSPSPRWRPVPSLARVSVQRLEHRSRHAHHDHPPGRLQEGRRHRELVEVPARDPAPHAHATKRDIVECSVTERRSAQETDADVYEVDNEGAELLRLMELRAKYKLRTDRCMCAASSCRSAISSSPSPASAGSTTGRIPLSTLTEHKSQISIHSLRGIPWVITD